MIWSTPISRTQTGNGPAAAPLEILVDDIAALDVELLHQEILERASPERHGPVVAENFGKVFELHVSDFEHRAEVIVEHLLEAVTPFVTVQELHQSLRSWLAGIVGYFDLFTGSAIMPFL